MEKILESIAVLFIGGMALMMLAVMFVYAPRSAYVESKCLESGYPNFAVDWKLRGYCMNLEGTVTVDVKRITE